MFRLRWMWSISSIFLRSNPSRSKYAAAVLRASASVGTFPCGEGDADEVSVLICVCVGLMAAKTRKTAEETVVRETLFFKGGDCRLCGGELIDEYLLHKLVCIVLSVVNAACGVRDKFIRDPRV